MRFLTIITLLALCFTLINSELLEPETYRDTILIIESLRPNPTSLIFVDPTTLDSQFSEDAEVEEESNGFFGNLLSTVSGIFSTKTKSTDDIIREMSQEGTVLKIDITNPSLNRLLDDYNVQIIPFIVVLKDGEIIYKGHNKPEIEEKVEDKKIEEEEKIPEREINIAPGKESFKESITDNSLFFSIDEENSENTTVNPITDIVEIPKPKYTLTQSTPINVGINKTVVPKYRSPYMAPLRKYSPQLAEYASTPVGYKANDFSNENMDQHWKKILKEEEELVDEIKEIFDEDKHLSDSLLDSEEEIHESEELFYKAKNAIDKSLQESENQMREYERELDNLYKARQAAKKARDNLYHPYPNRIPTKDGYLQQKLTGPYKSMKKMPSGPPQNIKFHDMLSSAENNAAQIDAAKKYSN